MSLWRSSVACLNKLALVSDVRIPRVYLEVRAATVAQRLGTSSKPLTATRPRWTEE